MDIGLCMSSVYPFRRYPPLELAAMEIKTEVERRSYNMRLIDADALLENYDLKNAVKYGNKSAEQQRNSYSTLMMYEIADMIDDAPTIIPRPDWTPCAEGNKLPKFGKTVQITAEFENGNRLVFQAYRMWTLFGSWYWMYTTGNRCWLKVIAWQPLTEPYNPDRKEDAKSDDVSQWPEWKQRAALSNYDFKKEDSE